MKTTATTQSSFYIECSLPQQMTISEYRRSRPSRPSRWERLKQLAGGANVVTASSV